MKKIIINKIKYFLVIIFIKTPLINILKKRFKNSHNIKKRNKIWLLLDTLFQIEYFSKLKNKKEIRELTNSTLINGEGRKWSLHYFDTHFSTLEGLKKRKGIMSSSNAPPIFEKMINFIKSNNIYENENTYIIQLGSSSGKDLEFFLKIFPKLNYISTDVNDEIIDFQKERYNYSNLKYFKCYAEDIDKCINYFNISDKNIILFSVGSLQYINPIFLEEFFLKIKQFKKINLFIYDPIELSFIEKNKDIISNYRWNSSFSHRYDEYARKFGSKIIESKIIRPFLKEDKHHSKTGNFYLHSTN